jgi:outer membrane protein TolC
MSGVFKRAFAIALLLIAGPAIDPLSAGQRVMIANGGAAGGVQQSSSPTTTQPGASRDITPLTLQAALAAARSNSAQFRSAVLAYGIASEDRIQAKAVLLPSLNGSAQYIYTTPNGTPSGAFVANNGPREYILWGQVHGDLYAPAKWADFHRAQAAEAAARAKADVAARGLVATVVQAYYGLVAAQHKAANARQSLREAQQFLDISQRQEQGGEVARSDVVKARIQVAQRQRDAEDADLTSEKNRIGLAVLVFPDFREDLIVVDDLQEAPPLGSLEQVKAAAAEASPDLRAAQASLDQESYGVSVARFATVGQR